jgi:hypothetical protein
LTAVEADALEANEREPMPGIGPMTPALQSFTEFFFLDPDLVEAAAERPAVAIPSAASSATLRQVLSGMTDRLKTDMLARLFDGDPHVGAELRANIRKQLAVGTEAPPAATRTVGELRARAQAIGAARERAAAEKAAAEERQRKQEAEKARRVRCDEILRRGESVWREVEAEIERRNHQYSDKSRWFGRFGRGQSCLVGLSPVSVEAATRASNEVTLDREEFLAAVTRPTHRN